MVFLPSHLTLNAFIIFGTLLIVGILGAFVAHKTTFFPRITAFMAVGLLFGPSGFGWITGEMVENSRIFIDIALGMIMFNLGRSLKLSTLQALPGIYTSSFTEIALTFAFIAGGFVLAGGHWLSSLMVAAIGISASPAIAMMVVQEFNAKGTVVSRSLPLLAMNNLGAFVIFSMLLPLVYAVHQAPDFELMLLHPLYLLAGSFGLAYVLYALGNVLAQKEDADHGQTVFPLLLGLLAFGIGGSKMLALSPLLTNLFLGMMISNLKHTKLLKEKSFGEQEEIFLIILFVLAGAKLHLQEIGHYAMWAVLFVVLRTLGKLVAFFLTQRASGVTWKQTLGITGMLTPMAGLAIGLSQMTENLFPTLGADLSMLILAGVAILETLGPIVSEWALKLNREIPDGPLNH